MTTVDSLAEQLRRAEARLEVLEGQMGAESESGVRTRSGLRAELSGRLMVNGFFNTGRANNFDNPQFVQAADGAPGAPVRGLGMSPRQSSIRLAVFAPEVAGGSLASDIDIDFYGGQQASGGGRTFPLVRLRTARVALRWGQGEVMMGQEVPLVAPLNPLSLAGLGTPLFAAAGNLWLWLPQLRGTVETASIVSMGSIRVGVQGAVLAPTAGEPVGTFDTEPDAAERSQRPYMQARVFMRTTGDPDRATMAGCGTHVGWLARVTRDEPLARSRAFACDARVWIGHMLEVRGEAFTGQALRGLGGGGIGQGIGPEQREVETRGGWVQLNVIPAARWAVGGGCGFDDPEDALLAAGARLENTACAAYATVRPFGPLFVNVEARRLTTRYAAGNRVGDHLNIGVGMEF